MLIKKTKIIAFPMILWLILLSLFAVKISFADETNYHAKGLMSFYMKRYQLALDNFQKSESLNGLSYKLSFNMGVTYYRLKQYRKAIDYFTQAIEFNDQSARSYLNLGLAQTRLNHLEVAKSHFQKTIYVSQNDKFAELALRMLDRIEDQQRETRSNDTTAMLFLTAGAEDKTESSIDEVSSDNTSLYLELFAFVSKQIDNDYRNGIGVSASYFGLYYDEINDYNLDLLSLSVDKAKSWNQLRNKLGAEISLTTLGGVEFQQTTSLTNKVRYSFNNSFKLSSRVKASYANSLDQSFDQLQGYQYKVRVGLRFNKYQQEFRTNSELEINDKKGVNTDTLVSSQSPLRYRIKAKYTVKRWQPYEFAFKLDYRDSYYSDKYISTNSSISTIRKEKRYEALFGMKYNINRHFSVIGELIYVKNNSTISLYQYDKREARLGIELLN